MRRYVTVMLAVLAVACLPAIVEAVAASWWAVAACTVIVFGALTALVEGELT